MRLSYRLIRYKDGFVAECVEADASGEGTTAREAVESLRSALEERMFRPDAIAPPPRPPSDVIELVLAAESPDEKREPIATERDGLYDR